MHRQEMLEMLVLQIVSHKFNLSSMHVHTDAHTFDNIIPHISAYVILSINKPVIPIKVIIHFF